MSDSVSAIDAPGRPRRGRWRRVLLILLIVLALLAAALGIAGYMLYSRFGQISVVQAPTTQLGEDADTEPLNVLLMGSDTRTGKGNNRYGLDAGRGGERSDTTILLHIAGDRQSALAVSIPRDLWVEQPECALEPGAFPYYAKFNNAFDAGGPACTVELVQEMTGVPVHHMAVVDFTGFKKVVEALGGVEVCLNQPVYDAAAKLDLPAGRSVVTGEQALAFVRARKAIGDGSDIGRMQRQQEFLASAARKASDTGLLLNPARLYAVLDTATSALTVDQSLDDIGEMISLAESLRSLSPEDITFVTMPFVWRADGANIDPDTEKAEQLWQAMLEDTPWPPRPDVAPDGEKLTVPPEEIYLEVLGPAKRMGMITAQLRAAGFNISGQQNRKAAAKTKVNYPPSQVEAARTVAFATDAAMLADTGVYQVQLHIGKDFGGVRKDVTVKKRPTQGPSGSLEPRSAAEQICAN